MEDFEKRLRRVYGIMHPLKASDHGFQAWFINELLSRHGLQIGKATMHEWIMLGVPINRLDPVDRCLTSIERECKEMLEAQVKQLRVT